MGRCSGTRTRTIRYGGVAPVISEHLRVRFPAFPVLGAIDAVGVQSALFVECSSSGQYGHSALSTCDVPARPVPGSISGVQSR